MADGPLVERLRRYLGELTPEARALLMAELERGLLRGDEMPGAELVLQELRREARETARPKRPGNLARLFFQPLEPFLVDEAGVHSHPGRISRAALEPFWDWICRDLLPGEAKAVTDQVTLAFDQGDDAKAEQLASAFQDRTVLRIDEALNAANADERARRRLAGQIGTQRALEDAAAIVTVLKARQTLRGFGAKLPRHIKCLDDALTSDIRRLMSSPSASGPKLFVYNLVLVMSRLAAPWQLIKLATQAAASDHPARIAETPYGIAVEIVLAEIERTIGELKSELRTGRGLAVGALLKSIHDAARGMRSEIDLSHDSAWSRRLAALRTQVSDLVKGEIENLPGRVRRLLRPRPVKEIAPGSALDTGDVEETEALIEFVGACRAYASELAINELTVRTWGELQQYLDVTTPALVECLRAAGPAERAFRQSQLDAAVRFCGKVFGEAYAGQMLKAADMAGAERKAAAKA